MNEKVIKAKKFPEYKQAVEDFLSTGFRVGEVIPHEWIDEHLNVSPSMPKYSLVRFQRFEQFRKALLHDCLIDMKNAPGVGYYIVHPKDQVETALDDQIKAMQKEVKKALDRALHVNRVGLTEAQNKADEIAIAAMVSAGNSMNGSLRSTHRKMRAISSGSTKAIEE